MNPLLARLQHELVNVAPDRSEWFASCLTAITSHKHADEFTAPSDNDHMASSEDDGFWPPKDDYRSNFRPYVVKQGVLHVPVMGVLLNRFPWQLGHWATGYTYIARAVQRGMEDEEVQRIAFICDSPGGEASGNLELSDRIFAYRGQKPMRAFASDRAYSAAYAIASAADRITMTRTGGVGSIGAYTMHIDYSEALERDGIKVTFIKFGERKTDANPFEKLSARAKARIQTRIDRLGELFVSAVAQYRGLDEQAVRDTEADCFGPEEAIELGLADQVEIFEDAMIAFTEDETSGSGEGEMTNNATVKPGEGAKVLTQADLDAAVTAARAEGKAEGVAEATGQASTAAKTRFNAILECEPAKKRPKAALACAKDTDMTVEQATAFLAALDEEKPAVAEKPGDTTKKTGATGALFEAAMDKGNPEVGSGEQTGSDASPDDLAAAILADQMAQTGYGKRPEQKAA